MEESGGRYDVAQICLNGHMATDMLKSCPEQGEQFCHKCGVATITACPNCNADIRGAYRPGIYSPLRLQHIPKYCHSCGASYPWTEKSLNAARELTGELQGLSEDEKALLAKDLDDIIADTPRTVVAATRWKKALSKVGKESGRFLRDILVDIVSESAKKILWP